MKTIRTYKRKLILSKEQSVKIDAWIGSCRFVYNMALDLKQWAYRNGVKLSFADLQNQLPEIRKEYKWLDDVPSQTLQNPITVRLKRAYDKFFSGEGFPKFRNKRNYSSITFPQNVKVEGNRVWLPKIEWLKMHKDAPVTGKIKTALVKKDPTGYFICITCEVEKPVSRNNESQVVGIDMGIACFVSLDNGHQVDNPKIFKHYEKKLAIEGRILSRRKKGSNRWKKQAAKLARLHHKVACIRKDFLHKESTRIARQYGEVHLEDLKIINMTRRAKKKQAVNGSFFPNGQSAKSGLNKSILDAGWGMFGQMLEYKTKVVWVEPKFSSLECSHCGHTERANRKSQSVFECTSCGHQENADINAAKNIKGRGTANASTKRPKAA
ncbi:MAG: transposase [Sediminibacterium sp.]|uniref:RNA-guided endonuclease InsQ/TnpB family protein n=1 Tax=Sediminibacterium sp. TaxID=1917865 RepID=UPI002ABC4DEE|nr:transposase [Sediminibacterium sp.]MDZ4071014.1 transposase [Sediminibacterium sp.]